MFEFRKRTLVVILHTSRQMTRSYVSFQFNIKATFSGKFQITIEKTSMTQCKQVFFATYQLYYHIYAVWQKLIFFCIIFFIKSRIKSMLSKFIILLAVKNIIQTKVKETLPCCARLISKSIDFLLKFSEAKKKKVTSTFIKVDKGIKYYSMEGIIQKITSMTQHPIFYTSITTRRFY